MYEESDLMPVSALQHFVFCPRQCALIHIEGAWEENVLTVQGKNLHRRAHTPGVESRPGLRKIFDMPIRSMKHGLIGKTDLVLKTDEDGYMPMEYKHGRPKIKEMDTVQLCAQAICLEEMTGTKVEKGYIYYFGTQRRMEVAFGETLRKQTFDAVEGLRKLLDGRITPPPVYSKKCESCSLEEECLPDLLQKPQKIGAYIAKMMDDSLAENGGGL